jgi:hypothetical protein
MTTNSKPDGWSASYDGTAWSLFITLEGKTGVFATVAQFSKDGLWYTIPDPLLNGRTSRKGRTTPYLAVLHRYGQAPADAIQKHADLLLVMSI